MDKFKNLPVVVTWIEIEMEFCNIYTHLEIKQFQI